MLTLCFLWFGDRAGLLRPLGSERSWSGIRVVLFLLPNGGSLAELRGCGLAFYCL